MSQSVRLEPFSPQISRRVLERLNTFSQASSAPAHPQVFSLQGGHIVRRAGDNIHNNRDMQRAELNRN